MNKRQAKKARKKVILLQGLNYKEHKKAGRDYIQYLVWLNHRRKKFNGFNDDEEFLIEMGIYTEQEIMSLYYGRKEGNDRWRKKRK